MKKIIPFIVSLIVFAFSASSQSTTFDNFYELTDFLYANDSMLHVPDSEKTGVAKDIDRMNNLWTCRLSPYGKVDSAAKAYVDYVKNHSIMGQSGNACGIDTVKWREEGPFGNVGWGNGQINRILFHPGYGISSNTIYAGSFYGGLWRSQDRAESWQVVNTDNQLAQSSVSGITVSHQDSNIIYISTGDGDLRSASNLVSQFVDGSGTRGVPLFTSGIYRSTDYGENWESINIGFIDHFKIGGTARDLIINPENDNVLYCATSLGFFRCRNAKASDPVWTKLSFPLTDTIIDFAGIAMHPTDTGTIYAAKENIYRSLDGGDSWISMTGPGMGLDFDSLEHQDADSFVVTRIKLAVTPADSSLLYAHINGWGYRICNQNSTRVRKRLIFRWQNGLWKRIGSRSYCDNNLLPETWMGFAVSPTDPEEVYFSYTHVERSHDSDSAFYKFSGYNDKGSGHHADVHDLAIEPNVSNPRLFEASHGGIAVKNTNATGAGGWTPKNEGFNTHLIWSFDVSKVSGEDMVMGRQDNGTNIRLKDSLGEYYWKHHFGGDGYGAQIIDEAKTLKRLYLNNSISSFPIPLDGEAVAKDPNQMPEDTTEKNLAWIPPSFQSVDHPFLNKSILGFTDLFSVPKGTEKMRDLNRRDWEIQSDLYHWLSWKGWRRIKEFAIAPSDTDYVYVATFGRDNGKYTELFRSTNGLKGGQHDSLWYGAPPGKFHPITDSLPFTVVQGDTVPPFITGIAVSSKDPKHLWVSVSGFMRDLRVLESFDAGDSWINADPNDELPQLSTNSIIYQDGTDDRIYLATDVGVFVKDNPTNCWKRFGDIPNVIVQELRINSCSNRMYAATYGRGIWSAELLPTTEDKSQLVIDTNTIWSENRLIERDLLVKAGSKLTIDRATLHMPSNGRIIVEPNAILVLDSGIITNGCGTLWSGIELQGDRTKDQFPLNHPTHQAKLKLKKKSLIENANEAIQAWDPGNYTTTGALIEASNSTIRNTRRAVSFLRYKQTNHSYFKKMKFINDSNMNIVDTSSGQSLSRVTIWDNKGIVFSGCTFEDSTGFNEYSEYNGNGIFAIDAGFSVRGFCSSPGSIGSPSCNSSIRKSEFNNFNQGIYVADGASSNMVVVENTKFNDNSISMRVALTNNVRFTDNKVVVGGIMKEGYDEDSLELDHQYGFYATNASDYEIEGNTFRSLNNPVMTVAGVAIKNSGPVANEVYGNTFKKNEVGMYYIGINRHSSKSFQGLQFLCNDYPVNGKKFDVQVIEEPGAIQSIKDLSGIRHNQGSTSPNSSPANIFSNTPGNALEGHIKYEAANRIVYHVYDTTIGPTKYTDIKVDTHRLTSNANQCVGKLQGIPEPDTIAVYPIVVPLSTNAVADYYDLRKEYNDLLYNYFQELDNGNTDSLIDAINLATPTQAQQLRDNLIAQSPYLSSQSLMSAALTGVLTDAFLLEVCLANPDATQSEGFLDSLEYDIPNTLPASMIQLIYLSWSTSTPRTIMEEQLAGFNAELGFMSKQILQHYLSDTLNHEDSIINMLNSRNSLRSQYRVVELMIEKEDFDIADTLMQDILNDHTLSTAQTSEHNNLQSFIDFRSTLDSLGKNYMELDEGELTTLRSIAEAETGRSSGMARNILCFGYGECISGNSPQTRIKGRPKRIYSRLAPQMDLESIETIKVKVQPNPADEKIRVFVEGIKDGEIALFSINTIRGKVLIERQLNSASEQINISSLKKGAYLYKVILNGKEVKSDKLIVQ